MEIYIYVYECMQEHIHALIEKQIFTFSMGKGNGTMYELPNVW